MKGIYSTGAALVHVPGWVDGWVDGWMEVKAVLRIAYSNQQSPSFFFLLLFTIKTKFDLKI
jgi:hypothetical protein